MMKELTLILLITLVSISTACDVQSGIARNSVDQHKEKPTPERSPVPTPTPIDEADIIAAEIGGEQGPMLSVNESASKRTVDCSKYNRLMVNGDNNTITVKGVCASVMFNGDGNTADVNASCEFVFNGDNNNVTYSKYINGRHFILTDNKKTNTVEKKTTLAKPTE